MHYYSILAVVVYILYILFFSLYIFCEVHPPVFVQSTFFLCRLNRIIMKKDLKGKGVDTPGKGTRTASYGSVKEELDRIIDRARTENEALRNVLDNIKTVKK